MFSQFTQLASKFSLDNLQDEPKDTSGVAASTTTPPVAQGGSNVSSRHASKAGITAIDEINHHIPAPPNAPGFQYNDDKREVEQLQAVLHNLKEEFRANKSSLSSANAEIDRLQEELRVETSANKDLYSRYQSLLSTNAAESATIRSLRDEINLLQTQLMTEKSSVEDLKGQLAVRATPVPEENIHDAVDTPKKTPKKIVKKKKNISADASDVLSSPSVDVTQSISISQSTESLNSNTTEITAQYEAELSALRNSLQNLEDDTAQSLQKSEEKHRKTQSEMTQRICTLQEDIARLHQELNEKENIVTSLTSENGKVVSDAAEKYQKIHQEFSRRIISLEELSTEKDNRISALNSKYQNADQDFTDRILTLKQQCDEKDCILSTANSDYQRIVSEKDQKINELTLKFSGLTEKAKDYVKKFSEAKNTISSLEEMKAKLTEDIVQITALKVGNMYEH